MNFEGLRRAIVGAVSEPEIVSDFLDERIDGPWRETYRYEEEHIGRNGLVRDSEDLLLGQDAGGDCVVDGGGRVPRDCGRDM